MEQVGSDVAKVFYLIRAPVVSSDKYPASSWMKMLRGNFLIRNVPKECF
jgi:hypothetical protein